MEVRPFRLLQLSDVLLDARLSFKGLAMGAGKGHERNTEALDTFCRMLEIARQRQADAVVITGNLWDAQSVTASTAARLVDAFAALEPIPVLIVPGTADPNNVQSLFNPKVLAAHAIRPWSRNVHVFADEQFQPWVHANWERVRFFGRASLGSSSSRVVVVPENSDGRWMNILVDYQAADDSLPAELAAQFDYCALGSAPNYTVLSGPDGRTRGASAGSLIARSIQELGPRTAVWVELDASEAPATVRLERLPADYRQVCSVAMSVNGIKGPAVAEHVRKMVEATGARPEIDLVHIRATGIYPAGQAPDFGEAALRSTYYHVIIDNLTRPDYYLDKMDERTTAGRFIKVLQELKNTADARGGVLSAAEYGSALTSKDLEDALYYGLDALNQKKVTVPDVD